MTQHAGQAAAAGDWAALRARRDNLRQAANLPGAALRPALDAALAELDAAIDALTEVQGEADGQVRGQSADDAHAERRLLRALFADAPVPLLLLEPDGTVRRMNRAAATLLGTGTAYATGKPFTAFVDLLGRPAVDSQLAAARRTGEPTTVRCEVLASQGTAECDLTAALARVQGDSDRLVLTLTPVGQAGSQARSRRAGTSPAKAAPLPGGKGKGRAEPRRESGDVAGECPPAALSAVTRRLDLVMEVTRSLLAGATDNEAAMLQRCARLLADEFSAWVIVDARRGTRLRRQSVAGPADERSAETVNRVAACDPAPGTLPRVVSDTNSSQLVAHVEDANILGVGQDGVPLLMLMGAGSVLSVPLAEGNHSYGALTLARPSGLGTFALADFGLIEVFGEQLARAISVSRLVGRQTEVADTLRASLLPPVLPDVPGVDLAAVHLAAENPRMGGDFYGVYRTRSGWGVSIGDGCGEGAGVVAVASMAHHAIRVLGCAETDPAAVLSGTNDVLVTQGTASSFVTAYAAHLVWEGASLRVTQGCAGHPAPILVRGDGSTRQLTGGGLPLGLFPDTELGTDDQYLSPGDILLFFTDGLADARNRQAGSFGDRLTGEVAALAGKPPGEVLSRLQEIALEFCHGDMRDDITMLALRVGEPPEDAQDRGTDTP